MKHHRVTAACIGIEGQGLESPRAGNAALMPALPVQGYGFRSISTDVEHGCKTGIGF